MFKHMMRALFFIVMFFNPFMLLLGAIFFVVAALFLHSFGIEGNSLVITSFFLAIIAMVVSIIMMNNENPI